MRILNLYAGVGGNRKLWQDVNVTAVEIDEDIAEVYSEIFPNDQVIIADAHKYLLNHYDEYDFIWSSPPCQSHSRMVKATRHDVRKYPDMSLYEEILWLKHHFNGKWVVENVSPYYEPLIPGKRIGRHLFWSNFQIGSFDAPNKPDFINTTGMEGVKSLKRWLGLDFNKTVYYGNNHDPAQILRNCVHPKTGKYILDRAQDIIIKSDTEQTALEL